MQITEFAPAKINLTLHVTGKRADGFHDLDSLVVFADIGDVLQAENNPTGKIRLAVTGDYAVNLGATEDNLVFKVARRVKEVFAVPEGADLTLVKNLPVASGIGGGSADAAATLRVLKRLWNLPDDGRLQHIAVELGSDILACLISQTCQMRGRGEVIEPVTVDIPQHLVLVNNGVPLATKDVFAQFNPQEKIVPVHEVPLLADTRNDLEVPAIALLPSIRAVLDALALQKGCMLARMSGSGATCFGLFSSRQAAKQAAGNMQKQQPHWWVKPAALYNRQAHG